MRIVIVLPPPPPSRHKLDLGSDQSRQSPPGPGVGVFSCQRITLNSCVIEYSSQVTCVMWVTENLNIILNLLTTATLGHQLTRTM